MTTKKRRNLFTLAVLTLVLTLLWGGCVNNSPKPAADTQTPDSTNASGTTATDAPDTSGDLVNNTYKTGLPIVQDKISLTTVISTNYNLNTPAQGMKMWAVLEDETNIHWEMQEIPDSNYSEKMNLLIAGDDLPQVIMRSTGEITDKYYNTDQFLPLDDLITQWAPNYARVLSDSLIRANVSAEDGHVYATPFGEIAPWLDVTEQLFLNTEWMETLNLTMPTNHEELYNVLKAFKEQDPNGNGIADELPLVFRMKRGANNALYLMGSFGLPINQDFAMLDDKTYVFGPREEAFRTALDYLHRLYADGLMDKENLTQDLSEMQAKGSSEHQLIGGLVAFWADDYCDFEETVKFDSVPVLTGPDGQRWWMKNPNMPTTAGMSITSKCPNPEAAIRWADYIIDSPTHTYTVWSGPEDLGLITITEDNKVHFNSDNAPEGMTYEVWTRRQTIREMFPYYLSQQDVLAGRTIDLNPQRKLDYIEKYMDYLYPYSLTTAHTKYYENEGVKQEATTILADLQPLVENFMSQSIINGITDESWNSFQSTLEKAKVERYLEIRQTSVDHYFQSMQ